MRPLSIALTRSALATAALLPCLALAAPESPPDPILQSLSAEAERTVKELKGKGDAPLYYLSYRVRDGVSFNIAASYGVSVTDDDGDSSPDAGRSRLLDVSARVGSPKLDNTHKIRSGKYDFDFGDGGGGRALLPIENDDGAIRLAIWTATDEAYKKAAKQFITVRTNKAVKVAEQDDAGDFAVAVPQQHIEPPLTWTVDRAAWRERVKKLSAIFKTHPNIIGSHVMLDVGRWTSYFVDSEGTRVREPHALLRLMITASVKADDGMELNLYRDFEAITPDQLPKEDELQASVKGLIDQLESLRVAPVIEPYSGPAIVTNRAAAVFFHEIFGHRIEGHRQKDADEGHTFTNKVGQGVVPSFISVKDDPTLEKFGDIELNGHYAFDEEGVAAQPVSLVDGGVLKGFLMGRSPIKGFAKSNGHGRAQSGLPAVARQGNLIVSSTKQMPFAQLREQLIQEAKKRGKPYGLMFEDISGGFTTTRAGSMPQAFKVLPLVVRRVFTDGRPDELVRGVDMIGTPLQSFEKILATGNDPAVFNGYCGAESGWVPVSAVAPSLLVGEVEVERRSPSHDRPPFLPPPLHPEALWPKPSLPDATTGADLGEGSAQ
jgi:predicted Zn-dependent protease